MDVADDIAKCSRTVGYRCVPSHIAGFQRDSSYHLVNTADPLNHRGRTTQAGDFLDTLHCPAFAYNEQFGEKKEERYHQKERTKKTVGNVGFGKRWVEGWQIQWGDQRGDKWGSDIIHQGAETRY